MTSFSQLSEIFPNRKLDQCTKPALLPIDRNKLWTRNRRNDLQRSHWIRWDLESNL